MKDYEARGERLLIFAVLERAIADAGNCCADITCAISNERIHAVKRAQRWIRVWRARDFERPYTFPWICIHLGVDPYVLRKALIRQGWPEYRKSQLCTDQVLRVFLDDAPTVDDQLLYHHG